MAERSRDIMSRDRSELGQDRDFKVSMPPPVSDSRDETEQIRADIEETRVEMGSTIDAIQEKLSPQRVIQEVKNSVREATVGKVKEVMQNVGEATRDAGVFAVQSIRKHPWPYILIGSGVGLLIVNQFRTNGVTQSYDRQLDIEEPGMIENAQTAIGGALNTVQEKAGDVAGRAREQIARVSNQVKEGAVNANDQVRQTFRERPLVIGGIALLAGALVALSIPTTDVEQEYLGGARDKLVDKAQDVAKDALQKVQEKVETATEPAGQQRANA